MIRITRYDSAGRVFHQRKDDGPAKLIYDEESPLPLCLSTPLRFWRILPGGRIEIEAA